MTENWPRTPVSEAVNEINPRNPGAVRHHVRRDWAQHLASRENTVKSSVSNRNAQA